MSEERRYRVDSVLGRGGFGTVYRAELTGPGGFTKDVALKVLNPDMEGVEEVARRFRDEARILGLIRHRAIVRVDGLVKLGGRQVVVMEFVEGVGLHQLIRDGVVPAGVALEMVAEIAGALDVAYNHKGADGRPLRLLHRDLKPSNVHLTSHGEVKVLDFGIARADFDEREAQTRAMAFGSTQYMAPERFEMIDSHAGDIYALGAVLYELIAGQPFGKTVPSSEKHRKMLKVALDAVDQRLGAESKGLCRLLASMLSYEAEDRPVAREVERAALELRRALGGESLRDWAEHQVPLVVATWPAEAPAELSGSTLFETGASDAMEGQASGPVAMKDPPSPRAGAAEPSARRPPERAAVAAPSPAAGAASPGRSYAPAAGLAAGALGLGLVVLGAVVVVVAVALWWYSGSREVEAGPDRAAPTATEAVEDAPVASPAQPAAPAAAPPSKKAADKREANKKKAAAGKAEAAAGPTEAGASTPPPASTEAAAAAQVEVRLDGDATRAILRGEGADVELQRGGTVTLLPGRYAVLADFGVGLASSGTVRLREGAAVTLSCDGGFSKCVLR